MSDRTLLIDGVRVPRFLYGTAWKEDRTRPLTELALAAGFRGIDTANQRRHYRQAVEADDTDVRVVWAGTGVSRIHDILPAGEIVSTIAGSDATQFK